MADICLGVGSFEPVNATPLFVRPAERTTCPEILSRFSWIASASDRRVECCVGPRARALHTHRFVACDGGGPLPVSAMLAAMRGRTIAFVGDSTMQQLWTGLVAELFAARHPIEITHRVPDYNMLPGFYNKDAVCTMVRTIKPQKPPSVGGSETQFRLDASAYPQSCNLTSYRGGFVGPQSKWPMYALCYSAADVEMWVPSADLRFLFYRVDHNGTKNMKAAHRRFYSHCNTHKLNFDAKLDAAIRRSDAVIANIGVWYNSEAQSEAYRSAVGHVMRRLNSLAPLGKLGVYRESVPQHFPTPTGSGLFAERDDVPPLLRKHYGNTCFKVCPPLSAKYAHRMDWRNRIAHEEATAIGFPADAFIPLAQLMRPMASLHKNTRWNCKLDCTHYCYHPDLWKALLDGVFRRLLRWAHAKDAELRPSHLDTSSPSAGRARFVKRYVGEGHGDLTQLGIKRGSKPHGRFRMGRN